MPGAEGRVRGVRVKTFYNDDGNLGTIRRHCKVVETQSPTNHGDSGGPVVNDRGEIVGVVQGGKLNANLLHYFIDVSEVRAFIKQVDELWSPTSARAYVARAKLLLDNQRLDRALADATAAVKADRKLSEAFQVRGDVFRARGDLESAVADYSQALELDATNVAAYLGRGQAYCRQRRLDEAVADFQTCWMPDGSRCPQTDFVECPGHNDYRGWWTTRWDAQFLLYDPADLARVALGEIAAWEPQPYAVIDIDEHLYLNPSGVESDLLGSGDQRRYRIGDVTYDRRNNLLYVLELYADQAAPIVHIWRIR